MSVDQEHVLDLVDQRMLEHDLGEGPSGAPGLQAPFEPAPGEAVFQRLIEPLERLVDRLADRFADRRHDGRIENVDERRGIVADRALRRLLHDGRQHMPHARIGSSPGRSPSAKPARSPQPSARGRPSRRSAAHSVSISRPTSKVRSCSSCRSLGRTPFGWARRSGFRLCAISTSRPASAFRSMASSPEGERSSPSRISGDRVTSRH